MIMRMIVMGMGLGVVGMRRMGMIVVPVRMIHFVAARVARMRADDGDHSCEDRAEQRQEDNGLNHLERLSPSSG